MPSSTAATESWFEHRDSVLHCESCSLSELADRFGTPLWVYSATAIRDRFAAVRAAFGPAAHICYAVKANPNLSLLRLLAEQGAGFDVVSGGELARLRAAGVPTSGVVFAGVGKQAWEIDAGLRAGILFFNVESPHELDLLERVGRDLDRRVEVAIRVNPDVAADTHGYIATGRSRDKFGLGFQAAAAAVARIRASRQLELVGYHVHLGSQLRDPEPYLRAFDAVAAFVDADAARSDGVRYYDLGGGFGIGDGEQSACDIGAVATALLPRIVARGWTPVVEPGRFLVGDAGLLLTRVIGRKDTAAGKRFVIVDGAMTELIRPALYGAEHPIELVQPRAAGAEARCDVVGPVCESGDFLAKDRVLPALEPGDLLAIRAAGAYGAAMSSSYNSRPRAAEVLVDGDQARSIRRRERLEELWALESDT